MAAFTFCELAFEPDSSISAAFTLQGFGATPAKAIFTVLIWFAVRLMLAAIETVANAYDARSRTFW
jgi:hypothetical protein